MPSLLIKSLDKKPESRSRRAALSVPSIQCSTYTNENTVSTAAETTYIKAVDFSVPGIGYFVQHQTKEVADWFWRANCGHCIDTNVEVFFLARELQVTYCVSEEGAKTHKRQLDKLREFICAVNV